MVDMANAIDFRLDIVMANFMLYGQKMKKVRMDYSCPRGNY